MASRRSSTVLGCAQFELCGICNRHGVIVFSDGSHDDHVITSIEDGFERIRVLAGSGILVSEECSVVRQRMLLSEIVESLNEQYILQIIAHDLDKIGYNVTDGCRTHFGL